eukprot:TRINITY_DN5446_c0_g4_i2.p1 TRINITY_DN5446_c0_g4~~TRINITY_DN5446_c0_g4_i2.p1  ORF type:complete len:312 (-),score=145.46 TRINITY_DN5446_c0_g4_i2:147-1082(-)
MKLDANQLEDEYVKLIEQLRKEDEEKVKREEEIKRKELEAAQKAEEPEEPEKPPVEEPTEDDLNQMMIDEFIGKFSKDYDLKGIMRQLSDEDIDKLDTVNDAMRNFLKQSEFPDLYKSKLKDSHFTPFIDFSEENLKRLFEESNGGGGQKGSEKDWIEFKEKFEKLKLNAKYRKGALSGIIRCEDVVKDDPNAKAPIEFDKKFLAAGEMEETPSATLAERFKLLEEEFLTLNGLKKDRESEKEEEVGMEQLNDEPLPLSKAPSAMCDKSDFRLPEILKKYKVNISMIEKRKLMSKLEIIERRCKIMDEQAI